MSVGRNHDLTNRVGQVVRIVTGHSVRFGLVPPDDDRAMVLVCLGAMIIGNDLLQEMSPCSILAGSPVRPL